jgi:hypothetical protein
MLPEEIRSFDKSKVEVVYLGDGEAIRVTNQPGMAAGGSVSNRLLGPTVASQPPHPCHLGADSGPNGRRFRSRVRPGRCGFDSSWARRVDSWERTFYQHRLPRLPYNGSTTNGNMTSRSAVKALGEIALRVNNLERMKRFYQEVLGFEVLGEFPTALEDRRRLCRPHPGARII